MEDDAYSAVAALAARRAAWRERVEAEHRRAVDTAGAGALGFPPHERAARVPMAGGSPYLTPLAVLVAAIEDSAELRAELPPEEYFELVNDVSDSLAPLLRKHHGTCGKPAGEGMVCYFLPRAERDHVVDAIACALEMKEAMRAVSRRWRQRTRRAGDVRLNIGLDEGEEWLGTCRTPTHVELTALGDASERSARLSEFAREGTVWATKNMLDKLRETVRYGIRRRTEAGETVLLEARYARLSSLIDGEDARCGRFRDVAALPVAEVLGLKRSLTS